MSVRSCLIIFLTISGLVACTGGGEAPSGEVGGNGLGASQAANPTVGGGSDHVPPIPVDEGDPEFGLKDKPPEETPEPNPHFHGPNGLAN